MPDVPDPLYVAARSVLLDGLEALGPQRDAVVLVGAHAVYLHCGQGDLATTPHTTDADLAIDPQALGSSPLVDEALKRGGFSIKLGSGGPIVGSWVVQREVSGVLQNIDLDLLVPEAVSGPGSRAARLGPHGDRTARKARGLELALIDNKIMQVAALEDTDARAYSVRVAGPAALLISKAHKVNERLDDPRRNDYIAKDALDMLRLLRGCDLQAIANTLNDARREAPQRQDDALLIAAAATTTEAIAILRAEFTRPTSRGCALAGRAAAGRDDPAIVSASLAVLATRLLERL